MSQIFRTSPPRSKNLLVVNKGPGAVELAREGDAWDLLEIYFMPDDIQGITQNPARTDAEYVVFETERTWKKYKILKYVFETTDFWQAYDNIMMADDDLTPVGCTIKDMFDLFDKTGCRIGQPALTQDSYYFWLMTIKNNNFLWRKTNFVEIMCPILKREAVRDYLPVFDATVTNWGLDFFWSYREWEAGLGVALLDSTPMRHGRPVGGGIAHQGLINPREEFHAFMQKNGIPFYPHLCLSGVPNPACLDSNKMNEILRLGLCVAGYDERFLDDPRFHEYVVREAKVVQEKFKKTS